MKPDWAKGYVRKGDAWMALGAFDAAFVTFRTGLQYACGHFADELRSKAQDALAHLQTVLRARQQTQQQQQQPPQEQHHQQQEQIARRSDDDDDDDEGNDDGGNDGGGGGDVAVSVQHLLHSTHGSQPTCPHCGVHDMRNLHRDDVDDAAVVNAVCTTAQQAGHVHRQWYCQTCAHGVCFYCMLVPPSVE